MGAVAQLGRSTLTKRPLFPMVADTDLEINTKVVGSKQRHLQITGNKANYTSLQRDTGTGLSVLLVP
jgi:hypothetical protein